MNKRTKMLNIQDSLRYFQALYKYNTKLNTININTHNKLPHELKKAEVCYHLQSLGHTYVTELPLSPKHGIPDVVDLCCKRIIEVLHSETKKIFEKKTKNYPLEFEIIQVKTSDVVAEQII